MLGKVFRGYYLQNPMEPWSTQVCPDPTLEPWSILVYPYPNNTLVISLDYLIVYYAPFGCLVLPSEPAVVAEDIFSVIL